MRDYGCSLQSLFEEEDFEHYRQRRKRKGGWARKAEMCSCSFAGGPRPWCLRREKGGREGGNLSGLWSRFEIVDLVRVQLLTAAK